jgi:F-type H+-transporting ATPase subunit b
MMLFQFIFLQVVVFSAVIFFMKKILSNDTQAAVGRLDSTYQDLLNKQKELNEKITEAEKEYEAKKEEAVQLAEKYKAQAIEESRTKKDEILKQAKLQADEMVERAKSSSEEHYARIEREVRAKSVETSAEILHRALMKRTLPGIHDLIYSDFLERAKDFDLTKVSPQIDTVSLKTPFALTEQQRAKLNAFISGKINRSLKVEEIIDNSMIAGICLQFGSLLLDGSLANSIHESAEEVKERIRLGQ